MRRQEEEERSRDTEDQAKISSKIRRIQRDRYEGEENQLLIQEDHKRYNKVIAIGVKLLREKTQSTALTEESEVNRGAKKHFQLLISETKKINVFRMDVQKLYKPQGKVVGRKKKR